jgi:hypothetical protein
MMRKTAGLIGAAVAAALLGHGSAGAQQRAQDVNPSPMVPGTRAGDAPGMSPGPGMSGPARTVPAARGEAGASAGQVNPTPMPPGSVAGQAPGMSPTGGAAMQAGQASGTTQGAQAGTNTQTGQTGVTMQGAQNAPAAAATQGTQTGQASGTTHGAQTGQAAGTTQGTQTGQATGTAPRPEGAPAAGATTPGRAAEGGGAPAGLESGANSFTAEQARDRIAEAGFADVQQLRLDDQGFWRGRAMRNGQPTGVAMDFRGRIAATQ